MATKLRITKDIVSLIREARDFAKMDDASFKNIISSAPIHLTESEVTDFIRERTELWRQTWIIGYLDAALEGIEGKWSDAISKAKGV